MEQGHRRAGHNQSPKVAVGPHRPGAAQHPWASCCCLAEGEVMGTNGWAAAGVPWEELKPLERARAGGGW